MSSIKYRAEIDGLRTLAILPVILFHAGVPSVQGGFLGVDVFFVISGFLISSIIFAELETNTFSLRGFWARRIRRIIPMLLVVTMCTIIVFGKFGYRPEIEDNFKQALSALLSISNFYTYFNLGNYWGSSAESSPFLHCWSLSLEEQFYLFFPVIAFWLYNRRRSYMLGVVVVTTLLSYALFTYSLYLGHMSITFYMLPTRVWELACGCISAYISFYKKIPCNLNCKNYLSYAGFFLIVFSMISNSEMNLGWQTIFPVFGCSLILCFCHQHLAVGRFLSSSPMVFIGKISYSMYLWHWPIIVFINLRYPTVSLFNRLIFIIPFTLILSCISYRYIEKTTRNRVFPLNRIGFAFASTIIIVFILGTRHNTSNFYNNDDIDKVSFDVYRYNWGKQTETETALRKRVDIESLPEDGDRDIKFGTTAEFKKYGMKSPQMILWGDSHAVMWASTIDTIARNKKLSTLFLCQAGKAYFIDERNAQLPPFVEENKLREHIKDWKPLIVVCYRWAVNTKLSEISSMIEWFASIGCRVIIIEQPPEISIGDRSFRQYITYLGVKPSPDEFTYFPESNLDRTRVGRKFSEQLAEKYHSTYFSTYSFFTNGDGWVKVLEQNVPLFFDDDHLSSQGAGLATHFLSMLIDSNFSHTDFATALDLESTISN